MATRNKKYAITNGPSFFEGILLDHWRDGKKDLPRFTIESVCRTFCARIHAIFNPTQGERIEGRTILLGEFADEGIDGCQYFVMYYWHHDKRGGILIPLESIEYENEILNNYFPDLFKVPKPSPVLTHLREMPWEKKMELAKGFVEDWFAKRENLAIAREPILSLLSRDERQKKVCTEINFKRNRKPGEFLPGPNDEDKAGDLFFALSAVCDTLNDFLCTLGMNFNIIPKMQMDTVNDDVITLTTEQKAANE